MDFTVELSKSYNVLPFVIMEEDKDNVIMMINYYILKGDFESETKVNEKPAKKDDGFWNF